VRFANTLAGALSGAPPVTAVAESPVRPPRPSFFAALSARRFALRFAFAAAVMVAFVGLPLLLVERAGLRDEVRQLREEQSSLRERAQEMERRAATEQARSGELRAQLEGAKSQPAPESDRQEIEALTQATPPRGNRPPRAQVKKNDPVIARRTPEPTRDPTLLNTQDATLGNAAESRRLSELPLQTQAAVEAGSVSFALTPGLVRGGGARTLTVPGKARFIIFQLNFEAGSAHENYSAVIEKADGGEVWRADSVKPRRPPRAEGTIELPPVPAKHLPPGDYIMFLKGAQRAGSVDDIANYSFRIMRN
jgi:hypothetical protein